MAEVYFDSENVHISDHAVELSNLYFERSNHEQIMKYGKFDDKKAENFKNGIRSYEKDIKELLKESDLHPTEIYEAIRKKGTNVYTWFDGVPSVQIISHAIVNCVENGSIAFDKYHAKYTSKITK